jgi:virulence factor Mce-like protein
MVAVSLVATLAGCRSPLPGLSGRSDYRIGATFANGNGLYPSAPVSLLGVTIGHVVEVSPTDGAREVRATLSLDSTIKLPVSVRAFLIQTNLLGASKVLLSPPYSSGPTLAPGSVIPIGRTTVFATTDQLLSGLADLTGALHPTNVADLVSNLSQDLAGQGAHLNHLIGVGSTAVALLSSQAGGLGQLAGSLAQVTTSLATQNRQIRSLVQSYGTVAAQLSAGQGRLADAIGSLDSLSQTLAEIVGPNLSSLEQDLSVATTAGSTLERNLGSIDTALQYAPPLFVATGHAVNPARGWLSLNLSLAPSVLTKVASAELGSLLVGVCQRLAARVVSTAGQTSLATTLERCADPSSGFFDPLLTSLAQSGASLAPTVGSGASSTIASALSRGLAEIPSLSPATAARIEAAAPPVAPAGRPKLPPLPRMGSAPSGNSPGWLSWLAGLL